MRIPNTLLTSNYMSDLQRVQQDIAKLLRQTSTGKLYERPRDNPSAVSTSLNLSRVISSTTQYTRNVDNGLGRLNFTEITLSEVNTQIQRVRELTVQGSSTVLTRDDRTAIAQEINQLLEHTVTLSNSNFSGRYVFSGFETLTESFRINSNTSDGFTNSVTYQGDFGKIGRNIGIQRDLDARCVVVLDPDGVVVGVAVLADDDRARAPYRGVALAGRGPYRVAIVTDRSDRLLVVARQ